MMTEHWENLNALTAPLLAWYDLNGRTLPWRSVVTPYRTWVSEIMLQQTRVGAVIPYFERFMEELPDVSALAAVSEERLLKLWEGLGYYSRARNLQKAAKVIVSDFGGALPQSYHALLSLPGIGEYTAAAIASINFSEPVAAVDGNLLRVAARVSGCGEDIMDAKVRRLFRQRLDAAIDANRPGAYNQAMMDLGATVCLPNGAPKCEICPARTVCEAYKNGLTEVLPVRAKKKSRRVEERTVLLLFQGGKVALRKRPDTGLLAGLWEYPNLPESLDEAGALLALAQMGLSAESIAPAGSAKHIFTHIEWDMKG
ncbi:MAG: A/G-specific adenine glycosylase, partial [Oscillospiraceae bacterium]